MKKVALSAILLMVANLGFAQGKKDSTAKVSSAVINGVKFVPASSVATFKKEGSPGQRTVAPSRKNTPTQTNLVDTSKKTPVPPPTTISIGGTKNTPITIANVTGNVTVNVTVLKDTVIATPVATAPAPTTLSKEPKVTPEIAEPAVIRYPNYRGIWEKWKDHLKIEKAPAFSYVDYSPEDSKKAKLKRLKHAVFTRKKGFRLAEFLIKEAEDSLSFDVPNIINTKKHLGNYGYITLKWNYDNQKWIMNFIYGGYSSSGRNDDVRVFKKRKGYAADMIHEEEEEETNE